jgi:hypothetical protein
LNLTFKISNPAHLRTFWNLPRIVRLLSTLVTNELVSILERQDRLRACRGSLSYPDKIIMSIKMCCSTRRLSGATRYLISRIAYGTLRSPGSNLAGLACGALEGRKTAGAKSLEPLT